MVPLDARKGLSSFLNVSITDRFIGNKLQWFLNAAKASSDPLYLKVGMQYVMASVASGGTAERITARIVFSVVRAGSGTCARYSSMFFAAALLFAAEARSPDFVFFMRIILAGCFPASLPQRDKEP